VVNVDMCGGTAKIAFCAKGVLISISASHIGARLMATDGEGRSVRI